MQNGQSVILRKSIKWQDFRREKFEVDNQKFVAQSRFAQKRFGGFRHFAACNGRSNETEHGRMLFGCRFPENFVHSIIPGKYDGNLSVPMRYAARYHGNTALFAGFLKYEASGYIVKTIYNKVAILNNVVCVKLRDRGRICNHFTETLLVYLLRSDNGFVFTHSFDVAVKLTVDIARLKFVAVAKHEMSYAETA